MKHNKLLFSLVFLAALVVLPIISAQETQLLCLTEGETVQFSDCNIAIPDYTCESDSCNVCVLRMDNGVYCTRSLNSCNNLQCSSLVDIDNPANNSTNNSTNNTGGNNGGNTGSNKVAYIVKTTADNTILNTITSSGYLVDVVTAEQLVSFNFNNYKLIVVNDDKFTSTEVSKIPIMTKPSVVLNTENLDDFGWTTDGITPSTTTQFPTPVIVGDRNSSITDGIGDSFTPYETTTLRSYKLFYLDNSRASGIKIIYGKSPDLTGKPTDGIITTVDKNVTLKNNQKTQTRGVFFGITDSAKWTAQTKSAFSNSLSWALRGEDRDNDNFYSDVDCNDNDASIRPGAQEIAYDGIDQDCDGRDWNDKDNDGFVAIVAGGNDCNDLDSSFRPNATDLTKNCVNDAPKLLNAIPVQTWNEDSVKILDLSQYFSDPDNNRLTYTVYETSSGDNLMLVITGDSAIFTPKANWNGEDWISFRASDGNLTVNSSRITLRVVNVNDAPVIANLTNVKVVEGALVQVDPTITDIDGDNLTISYSNKLNSNGEWQTAIGNAGSYVITLNVNDGKGGLTSAQFRVDVIGKIFINEFVSDSDSEWIELYNPGNQEVDLSGFTLEDNTGDKKSLSGKISGKGFLAFDNLGFQLNNGGDKIVLMLLNNSVNEIVYGDFENGTTISAPGNGESSGRSPDGSDNWIIFEKPTKGLPFNADVIAPVVEMLNEDNIVLENTRDLIISFMAKDNTQEFECGVYSNFNGTNKYSNGKRVANDTVTNLTANNIPDGNYIYSVRCSDGISLAFSSNRSVTVSAPDAPVITTVSPKTVRENQTVEFTITASDQDGDALVYSVENLPEGASFNSSSRLFSWKPTFSQQGEHDIVFKVVDTMNNQDTETVRVSVVDVEVITFDDADVCKVFDSDIKVSIDDPDSNDDFEIGETIDITVKVKNNKDDEDVDLDVKAYLYDITDEESVEDVEDDISVDEDDSEEVELSLKIPNDADVDNKFAIYVIASEDEDEFCNSEFVKITLERPDEKLEIRTAELMPESVRRGESADLKVTVKNIGEDELEDVYVQLSNSDLKLNLKSDYFDLEEFDEDDTNSVNLNFIVPANSAKTQYTLKLDVFYEGQVETENIELYVNDGSFTVSPIVNITKQSTTTAAPVYLTVNDKPRATQDSKPSGGVYLTVGDNDKDVVVRNVAPVERRPMTNGNLMATILWIIDIILIIGIIAVLIVIISVVMRRDDRMVVGKVVRYKK